jgi:hypothetical protein
VGEADSTQGENLEQFRTTESEAWASVNNSNSLPTPKSVQREDDCSALIIITGWPSSVGQDLFRDNGRNVYFHMYVYISLEGFLTLT